MKGVWLKRPKGEARRRTGKSPISVKWVDINKGDDLHPRYRSRLVARQLKATDPSGQCYFAPAPPLESLRAVISMAATTSEGWHPCYEPNSHRRMQLAFIDISRAYFCAATDPNQSTYVELPEKYPWRERGQCGLLLQHVHVYGPRKAADGWHCEQAPDNL